MGQGLPKMKRRYILLAAFAFVAAIAVSSPPAESVVGHAVSPMATAAAVPTARAATSSEMAEFMQFAPSPPPTGSWRLDEAAVGGQWALVGFYNEYAGITALLQQDQPGNWSLIERGGGQITPAAMLLLVPNMPSSLATSMYKLAVSQDLPGINLQRKYSGS